ncbi:16696_t:CDS:2, partial [Funneliformis mosseae]
MLTNPLKLNRLILNYCKKAMLPGIGPESCRKKISSAFIGFNFYYDWKFYARTKSPNFETYPIPSEEIRAYINVGGSVWAMDWCPNVSSEREQYLAIGGYKSTIGLYGAYDKLEITKYLLPKLGIIAYSF